MMKKIQRKSKRSIPKKSIPRVLIEASANASFTCFVDSTTAYNGTTGVSGYYLLLTADKFTGLNAFQSLFLYYTPQRTSAELTMRSSLDNGCLFRFRVLDPIIDSSFSGGITEPVQMSTDPSTIQCVASYPNPTSVLRFKNRKMKFAAPTGTSDKLGAIWVTFPIATESSGVATFVLSVHICVSFTRKNIQIYGT